MPNALQGGFLRDTTNYALAVSGLGPPPFLADSFTGSDGTLLSAHAPDTGGTWIKNPGVVSTSQLASNALVSTDSGFSAYYNTTSPGTANYRVRGTVKMGIVGNIPGVAGRMDTAALTCYYALYQAASGWFELGKIVAGSLTTLDTDLIANVPGQLHTVELVMNGTTISMNVDGVQVSSLTDASIAGPGQAGVVARFSDPTAALLNDMSASV